MSQNQGVGVIGPDLTVLGDVKNCRQLDVYGLVRGKVTVEHLRVHSGGCIQGPVHAGSAEVNGMLQGEVLVRNLISIGNGGHVSGVVRYGRLALAEGGELNADVRNIPPQVGGDFQVVVRRGRSVRLTTEDITAIDPDDKATTLVFAVSNPLNGFVALTAAPAVSVQQFTQADLEGGRVLFVHGGQDGTAAGFDVVVTDAAGASSGAPKSIHAAVVS